MGEDTVSKPFNTIVQKKALDRIPQALKDLKQWVVWRAIKRDGTFTKVPFQALHLGSPAKANDPNTWSHFDDAVQAIQQNPDLGLGFEFSPGDPFTGVDLDKCRNPQTGTLDTWAEQVVQDLNSYTEVSPSGTGVHILVQGTLPGERRRTAKIEMYQSHRFFCMTGDHVTGTPTSIELRQSQLETLHSHTFTTTSFPKHEGNGSTGSTGRSALSDDEVLRKAGEAKNDGAFHRLYEGYWHGQYPSHSEADLALCGWLASLTGGNREQMDRLFRASGLMRPKWDERRNETTYGENVLSLALEGIQGSYRSEAKNETKRQKLSPADLAEQFLQVSNLQTQEGLHLRWHREGWFKFDGRIFVPLPLHDLKAHIMAFLRNSASRNQANQTLVKNVLVNLEAICQIPSDADLPAQQVDGAWVSYADKLVFHNGVLDLKELVHQGTVGEFLPHSPHMVSTIGLPFSYDENAKCPQWQQFLEQILPDKDSRQFLQEIFGYCLTPDTSLQKFFLFEGTGGNGKSVVLRVLTTLLGPANVSSLPLELFGASHGLEVTLGKLANVTTDIGDMDRVAEGLLKQFTGEDLMYINPKYKTPFSAKPTAKLIMAANTRPPFRDKSDGIWRRLMILVFPITIPEADRNPQLTDMLIQEMPGIMNWAILGAQHLRKRGMFDEPLCSRQARMEFQAEANPTTEYLLDNFYEDSEHEVSVGGIYKIYRDWCQNHEHHPVSLVNFGREVRKVFPKVKRIRLTNPSNERGYWYQGIKPFYTGSD